MEGSAKGHLARGSPTQHRPTGWPKSLPHGGTRRHHAKLIVTFRTEKTPRDTCSAEPTPRTDLKTGKTAATRHSTCSARGRRIIPLLRCRRVGQTAARDNPTCPLRQGFTITTNMCLQFAHPADSPPLGQAYEPSESIVRGRHYKLDAGQETPRLQRSGTSASKGNSTK